MLSNLGWGKWVCSQTWVGVGRCALKPGSGEVGVLSNLGRGR